MSATEFRQKQVKHKIAIQQLWFLHWLMASFYLLLFVGGKYMTELPRGVSYRGLFYDFHKTLGVVVMSILLARIFVLLIVFQHRYKRRIPQLTGKWWQTFALHSALYFFMLLVPLSGYLFSYWGGHPVNIFGTHITLPSFIGKNQALSGWGRNSHVWLSYTFLALTILHILNQRKYLRGQLRRFYKAVSGAIR